MHGLDDGEGFMMKVMCGVCMDRYLIHRLAKSGMRTMRKSDGCMAQSRLAGLHN